MQQRRTEQRRPGARAARALKGLHYPFLKHPARLREALNPFHSPPRRCGGKGTVAPPPRMRVYRNSLDVGPSRRLGSQR